MQVTAAKNEKIGQMIFASIYPLYLNRPIKNGRTEEERNCDSMANGFDNATLQSYRGKSLF